MDTPLQDARHALAVMRRNKAFSAGLVTLALGSGATTAVVSLVYGDPAVALRTE